jgi:Tfp pilus assembly PilM family ATPase
MIGRLSSSYSLIGVDMGARVIKAVQTRTRAGQRSICAMSEVRRTTRDAVPSEAELRALMATLSRQGFRGRRMVVCAPRTSSISAVLDLPPRSSGAPVEDLARAELSRTLKCNAGELELGLWELPTIGRGPSATASSSSMLVAFKTSESEQIVSAFEDVGAEVVAIDAPCLAMARAAAGACEPGTITTMLEIGRAGGRAVVLLGKAVIYERALPEGSVDALLRGLGEHMRIDDEVAEYLLLRVGFGAPPRDEEFAWQRLDEARRYLADRLAWLVRELQASIAYASGRYHSARQGAVLLTGTGAAMPEIGAYFAMGLGLPCRVLRPRDVAGVDALLGGLELDPGMTMATGLSGWTSGGDA